MCQLCVDAVKKWFPTVPKKQYGDLLMSATCFPMGDPQTIERQLRSMAEKGITTLEGASAYACEELFKASKKIRKHIGESPAGGEGG